MKKENEDDKLREENKLKKKLDRIRSQVRVEVERDGDRMKSETESFKNYRESEGRRNEYPFEEVYGYTTEMLMKDMRVRVQEALRINQLDNHSYAKHILMNAKTYKNVRRDMLESK